MVASRPCLSLNAGWEVPGRGGGPMYSPRPTRPLTEGEPVRRATMQHPFIAAELFRGRRLSSRPTSSSATAGLEGIASPEQVRAMLQGLDTATGEQGCAPLWRADPHSKLTAG